MILWHKVADVKPPPWKMHRSAEKLYEKYFFALQQQILLHGSQ